MGPYFLFRQTYFMDMTGLSLSQIDQVSFEKLVWLQYYQAIFDHMKS